MPQGNGPSFRDDPSGPESPSQFPKDPLLGQQVGNYRVESVLGRGGFGVVYQAHDVKLGRKVALKFLTDASDDFHSQLFEREAKAIAALSKHPNIVQIYNWDEFRGNNFLALEYVELSATDLLKKSLHGLPWRLACKIAAECAEALAHAHRSGILHRDIKPANILIEGDDRTAKLADFGLARVRGVSSNTIAGSVIGSPAFMSPEQVRGAEVTKLSDIYSLGVTLYQLLCGRTPVEGESHLQILAMIRDNRAVPLLERRPDIPSEVCKIVAKATAHDEKKRYQSADAFAGALRQVLAEDAEPRAATPALFEKYPAFLRYRRHAIVAAALLIFSLVFVMVRNSGPAETEAAPVLVPSTSDEIRSFERDPHRNDPERDEPELIETEQDEPETIEPQEDDGRVTETTVDTLEKAGDFIVDKSKNAKDRVKRFFRREGFRNADDKQEPGAPDPEP